MKKAFCTVLAIGLLGCGDQERGDQSDQIESQSGAASFGQNDLPVHASAVAVNVSGAHWTWAFVRTAGSPTSGTLLSKRRNHATGAWDATWTTQGSCCIASHPYATVWKQTSGNDKIVLYLLQADQNLWSLTIDPATGTTGTFDNISTAAGLPPNRFTAIHSAVTTGTGTSRKVNLVVSDASNNLFTLDFKDFGATGWAVHPVQLLSSSGQVNTRGYSPTLSLDGQVMAGRNTLASGNEALAWHAGRIAGGFKIDSTASTPGATGLPVPGRFTAGQAGSLTDGFYYKGASTSLLTRVSTSLCTSKTVLGSATSNTHAVVISQSTSDMLINGLPGACLTAALPSTSAPVLSDNSHLTGWTQAGDGVGDLFYRSSSGTTLMTCFFQNGSCGHITDLQTNPSL